MKTTIEVHTFNLRLRASRRNLSFSGGIDIYRLFKDSFVNYVDGQMTGPIDNPEVGRRTLRIPAQQEGQVFHGFNDAARSIYGILQSGMYGKRLEVVDKDDPRHVLYMSNDNNGAVIKPFFFLISIPRSGDVGYIVLERTDNEGIYPLFHALVISFLNDNLPQDGERKEYALKPHNYLSHDYVDNLRNGTIKSVRLTLNSLPDDLADRYMLPELDKDTSISIVLNFKGGLLPGHKIAQRIKDHSTIFSSDEINELFNESNRSIVTTSEINGVQKDRTVYLNHASQNNIRPYYILDVNTDERGYSDYNSIKDAVFDFIASNQDLVNLNQQN